MTAEAEANFSTLEREMAPYNFRKDQFRNPRVSPDYFYAFSRENIATANIAQSVLVYNVSLPTNIRQIQLGNLADKLASIALEKEFHSLVKQWQEETSFHSSLGEIFTNEAYQRIMAMGRDALPLIFSDLKQKPRFWFYALEKIVGSDVAAEAKNYGEARAIWLKWGYKHNYI